MNTDVIDVASTLNQEQSIQGATLQERGRNNSA